MSSRGRSAPADQLSAPPRSIMPAATTASGGDPPPPRPRAGALPRPPPPAAHPRRQGSGGTGLESFVRFSPVGPAGRDLEDMPQNLRERQSVIRVQDRRRRPHDVVGVIGDGLPTRPGPFIRVIGPFRTLSAPFRWCVRET